MRITVVPAQITTVEDRIAGNLTFVQVLLLVAALLVGSAIYLILPPKLHLGGIKLTLICLDCIIFVGLSLRIRGKIIADWLILYLRYHFRPRIYVFTKNDLTARDVVTVTAQKTVKQKKQSKQPVLIPTPVTAVVQAQVDHLLDNPAVSVRFALAKKGGVDVSLTPIKQ